MTPDQLPEARGRDDSLRYSQLPRGRMAAADIHPHLDVVALNAPGDAVLRDAWSKRESRRGWQAEPEARVGRAVTNEEDAHDNSIARDGQGSAAFPGPVAPARRERTTRAWELPPSGRKVCEQDCDWWDRWLGEHLSRIRRTGTSESVACASVDK